MPSASDYSVRAANTPDEILSALDVREKVFTEEQGFPADVEIDTNDPAAIHFIVFPNSNPSKVVGTVRFNPYPFPDQAETLKQMSLSKFPQNAVKTESETGEQFHMAALRTSDTKMTCAKVGRVALLKEVRGIKLGEKTIREAEKWLEMVLNKKMQVDRVQFIASSQVPVIGFYEKLGYKQEGESYDEDGQPHKLCRKVVELK